LDRVTAFANPQRRRVGAGICEGRSPSL